VSFYRIEACFVSVVSRFVSACFVSFRFCFVSCFAITHGKVIPHPNYPAYLWIRSSSCVSIRISNLTSQIDIEWSRLCCFMGYSEIASWCEFLSSASKLSSLSMDKESGLVKRKWLTNIVRIFCTYFAFTSFDSEC
jgi:hypothetical protein